MSAQPKANEPSMEEILASIRKIIADDQSKAPATPAAEPVAPPAPPVAVAPPPPVAPVRAPPPPDDDILELGSEAMPLEEARKDDIDLLFEAQTNAEALSAEPAPLPAHDNLSHAMMQAPATTDADMASLLSNQASHSISNAFGSLAHTVLSQNARTVDDLVKEMLKPLLKGWLDDNLPALVERLVRAEIERVARGGR